MHAAAHAAGVVGDHAADARDVAARRVGPELAAVARQQPVDVAERRSRAGRGRRAAVLEHLARCQCRRTSTRIPSVWAWPLRRRAAGAEDQRHARAPRERQQLDDVVDVVRHRDRARDRAVGARVGGVADEVESRVSAPGRRRARAVSCDAAARACRRPPSRARGPRRAAPRARARRRPRSAIATQATSPPRPAPARAAARPAPRSPRAGPSVSSSRLVDVDATARRSRGRRPRRRAPGRSSPGAPVTCSSSANHLRIMYSSLRSTRNVTGTL